MYASKLGIKWIIERTEKMKRKSFFVALACMLLLTLSLSASIAESTVAPPATPDDVIFWRGGQNSLTIEPLADGTQKISWTEAPNAEYYYLVVCQKGFVEGNTDENEKSSTWSILIWERYNDISDSTQKSLAVIAEYDTSLWCRSDTNEYVYEPSDALTTLVYAQNNIAYDTVDGKVVPSQTGPQLESVVENIFVFYVEKKNPATPSPTVSAAILPASTANPKVSASPAVNGEESEPYKGVYKEIEIIGFVKIKSDGKVNLRLGDTTEAPVVQRVDPGSTLVCIDITPRGWYVVYGLDFEILCVAPSVAEFTPIEKK